MATEESCCESDQVAAEDENRPAAADDGDREADDDGGESVDANADPEEE